MGYDDTTYDPARMRARLSSVVFHSSLSTNRPGLITSGSRRQGSGTRAEARMKVDPNDLQTDEYK
jgi:hypothetical protein